MNSPFLFSLVFIKDIFNLSSDAEFFFQLIEVLFPWAIGVEFHDLAGRVDLGASLEVSEDQSACRKPRFGKVGESGSEFCAGESDSCLETSGKSGICKKGRKKMKA